MTSSNKSSVSKSLSINFFITRCRSVVQWLKPPHLQYSNINFSAGLIWWAGGGDQEGAGCQKGEDSRDGAGEILGFWDDDQAVAFVFLTEPKADAQVCAKGHGGSFHWGDEHCCEHLEEQPGVSACSAGRQERELDPYQEDAVDQHSKVWRVLIVIDKHRWIQWG